MPKLIILMFILLVLKIQSFACETNDIKTNLLHETEKYSGHVCKIAFENKDKKSILVDCENNNTYTVSYDTNSIYFLTRTISKYPYISQCWIDGQISNSCSVQFSTEKCQTWNMKD